MIRLTSFAAAATALALAVFVSRPSIAAELVYGSWTPAQEYQNRVVMPELFRNIERDTNGAVKWKLIAAGQIADGKTTFTAVKDGLMQAGLGIVTYVPNAIPSVYAIYSTIIFGENDPVAASGAALVTSMRAFVGGLVIAVVIGVFLGVVTGRWRTAYNAFDPLVSALYSVPSVALIPLIGFIFKYQGDAPRVAAVALFCVFPVLINTQQGVRNVDRGLMEVARAFNTSERRLWTDVILPSATPYVLAGIRLSIGRGLIGMIVAEFFIGLVGLGYLIIQYGNVFRIDRMFVPVIVVAAMGIVFMGLVQWLEGRVAPWLRREQ